jgi:selenocysteine-specific elongation factor
VLLEGSALTPGGEGWAQVRLESPAVAAAGDRAVLRSYSPPMTIGGATIVDPFPAKRSRFVAGEPGRLESLRSGSLAERLRLLAADAGASGLGEAEATLRLGDSPARVAAALAEIAAPAGAFPPEPGRLIRLADGRFLAPDSWRKALDRILAEVDAYAKAHRLRDGVAKGELKSLLKRDIPAALFDQALEALVSGGSLAARGEAVVRPEAGPRLDPAQEGALKRMEACLRSRGFQVPETAELSREVPPALNAGELLRYLVESGRAVKVTSDLYYASDLWGEIEARVRAHFRDHAHLNMASFKEMLQISRKYAVPLLEHLDRVGLTRREGDERLPGPRL